MDALDEMIQAEKAELGRLEAAVSKQRIKVDALMAAAEARPVSAPSATTAKKKSAGGKGKPKGAISKLWQEVLGELYAFKGPWQYVEVQNCFEHLHGKKPELASVRDRVRSMIDNDYMSGNPDEGFIVTDYAAQKFGFKRSNEFGESAPNAEGESVAAPSPSDFFNTQTND